MSALPPETEHSPVLLRTGESGGKRRIVLPFWRFLLALFLAICPWAAAGWGLYRGHSAILSFLGYHALCLGGGLLLHSPGLPPTERLYPMRRRALLAAVVGANGVTLVAYLIVGASLLDKPHVLALLGSRGLPPTTYFWLFPYFALVNPLAEEFFWRGGVYATLRHLYASWVPAACIDAVLFGSWHWLVVRLFVPPPEALAATAGIAAIGFALAVVYERTHRLAYGVILHALAGDAPLLLLLLLLGLGQ